MKFVFKVMAFWVITFVMRITLLYAVYRFFMLAVANDVDGVIGEDRKEKMEKIRLKFGFKPR